ncbi:hypothetical protein CY34DRAFT_804987 [Suillus luteus UH-Slu-Lm8-n1]|uniref:Uncharacterized protein n=1 Tax=Suillus luteus UH-Slu-Lm8-n1 TaxID=930992 RepID=A0A0C9ZXA7_9AGAM|nr:hypothetical protein CY34DRAFT_804987 [Suillus luteus UH-Slu-Lm8-n1]
MGKVTATPKLRSITVKSGCKSLAKTTIQLRSAKFTLRVIVLDSWLLPSFGSVVRSNVFTTTSIQEQAKLSRKATGH